MKFKIKNATQEDVDIMELALDLVDRCSFLAGDLPPNRRLEKRRALAEAHEEEIDGVKNILKKCLKIINYFLDFY